MKLTQKEQELIVDLLHIADEQTTLVNGITLNVDNLEADYLNSSRITILRNLMKKHIVEIDDQHIYFPYTETLRLFYNDIYGEQDMDNEKEETNYDKTVFFKDGMYYDIHENIIEKNTQELLKEGWEIES